MEGDVAHVRQPGGGHTGSSRKIAVVRGVALRFDFVELNSRRRLAEDVGPDEQIAVADRRLEDRHLGTGEQVAGLPERIIVVEGIDKHALRKVKAGERPDAVALVCQRFHHGIALPLVGILARFGGVEQLCGAAAGERKSGLCQVARLGESGREPTAERLDKRGGGSDHAGPDRK